MRHVLISVGRTASMIATVLTERAQRQVALGVSFLVSSCRGTFAERAADPWTPALCTPQGAVLVLYARVKVHHLSRSLGRKALAKLHDGFVLRGYFSCRLRGELRAASAFRAKDAYPPRILPAQRDRPAMSALACDHHGYGKRGCNCFTLPAWCSGPRTRGAGPVISAPIAAAFLRIAAPHALVTLAMPEPSS